MATKTIAGKTVQVNDEGFMTDPAEWDKDIAVEIAKEEGIPELIRRPLEDHRLLPPDGSRLGQRAHPARHHHRLGHLDQRAVHPVPQGSGEESRQDFRAGQARRLRLNSGITKNLFENG